MKSWYYWVILIVVALAAGRFLTPAKITTVEVEKIVKVKDERVVTKYVKVQSPDGTVTETKDEVTVSREDTTKDSSKETIKQKATDGVRLGLIVGYNFKQMTVSPSPTYGIMISKQVVGPLHFGLMGTTTGELGAVVGVQF